MLGLGNGLAGVEIGWVSSIVGYVNPETKQATLVS
jgi:hypothetical protein